jgi:RNA polymerase sigma-70 factor (ECF subfamily)
MAMTTSVHPLSYLLIPAHATSSVSIKPAEPGTTSRPDRTIDAGVIAQAARGDGVAQRAIYEQHADRIFRLAHRMTGDVAAAEDLTQDVFIRAFGRLRQFRGDSRFGTWLHRLAVTVILNGTRQRGTEQREVTLDPALMKSGGHTALEPDAKDRVRRAVAELPSELRIVVLMYDVEGYSHDEIAELTGVSSGASRMRLLRARQLLRASLAQDAEEFGI